MGALVGANASTVPSRFGGGFFSGVELHAPSNRIHQRTRALYHSRRDSDVSDVSERARLRRRGVALARAVLSAAGRRIPMRSFGLCFVMLAAACGGQVPGEEETGSE